MGMNDEGQGTGSDDPTLDAAARGFDALISAEENPKRTETPPTQKSPAPESDEDEEDPESPASEDEAAKPADEPEESPEEPADSIDPATRVRVMIDGKEEEVTLEEALKGYSRTAVFTRKTQELATQRKAQEAEFQAVRAERAKYAELLTGLDVAWREATGPEPDWAKVQAETPNEFPMMWAQWQQRQKELQIIAEERQRATEATQRDTTEAYHRYVGEEQAKLLEALPEWKDPEKAKAGKAELVAHAEKLGFSREELAKVGDHRLILLLRKAMLHDKAQAAKPAIAQRIQKVKTATPGPKADPKKPVSEATRARQRLAKTGSIDDAAAAFSLMLGDR